MLEESFMDQMINLTWKMRIWQETLGQDLIEYALMSGLIATAAVALSPQLAAAISQQFSRVAVPLSQAAAQGS